MGNEKNYRIGGIGVISIWEKRLNENGVVVLQIFWMYNCDDWAMEICGIVSISADISIATVK
jgi:hypothetical protein